MFVAGFIGSPRMNFIDGTITAIAGREVEVRLGEFGQPVLKLRARSDHAKLGDVVSVGIRPEHFVPAGEQPTRLAARAQVVEQLGGVSYVYANSESGKQITVQQRGHTSMASGTAVEFGVDPATVLMFDRAGLRI